MIAEQERGHEMRSNSLGGGRVDGLDVRLHGGVVGRDGGDKGGEASDDE